MRIAKVEAVPFHAERDRAAVTGTAGSPARLQESASVYRWAEQYPVLYSTRFETALVRVTLDSGLVGFGEAQAPVAPEVACTIIDRILAPILVREEFAVEPLWWRMYSAMRVRGQTGGFMLDAIAGVDLALWDLAGKIAGRPVSALIGDARSRVPAYLSGLPGGVVEGVRPWVEAGFRHVKIFHQSDALRLARDCEAVRGMGAEVAVDALWRLTPEDAPEFVRPLGSLLWLEAPLAPESARLHGELARRVDVPIAIGESYRTVFELEPFFEAGAMRIVQPDLGRTGITEGLGIARAAERLGIDVIPHVSIAMGPQLAAAIHFAASVRNCSMLEFNPTVVETANRYLTSSLAVDGSSYVVPEGPGLGVDLVASFG